MPWFKITLAYDGAEFCGWQRQASVRTVQGVFEEAWRAITGESISVNASGRTDRGVHAAGQVVSAESTTSLAPATLVQGLNAALPPDVVVRSVEFTQPGFHATTDARWKRYRYLVLNSRRRPIVWRRFAWHVPSPLDVAAMDEAAQRLVGKHDFCSFQTAGSHRQSTIRTVYGIDVRRSNLEADRSLFSPHDHLAWETRELIAIDVAGDGFLYHMVRAIAGTLVHVGRGKQTPSDVVQILQQRRRSAAGQTAPAYGLTLVEVGYGDEFTPSSWGRGGEGGAASVPQSVVSD